MSRTRAFNSAAVILACFAFGYSGCGYDDDGSSSDGVDVRKVSANTWEIHDPDSYPNRHVKETCETEGKVVVDLDTPGEAYDWLNVTCGDPQPSPTPMPTPEDTYLP